MNCSVDMAKSIAGEWRDSDTLLTAYLAKTGLRVSAMVLVREFSDKQVVLESPLLTDRFSGEATHAPFELALQFDGLGSFEYSDPREEPVEFREQSEAMFVCTLTIKTNGFVLMLTEPREQPETI